jgi:hypothetical protein
VVPWLALPATVLLLAVGFGELVARASGVRLGAALGVLVGFAAYLSWANLAIVGPAAAAAVGPGALVLAAVGWILAWRRGLLRPPGPDRALEWWPIAGAGAAFLFAAAPFLAAGHPAFGGYGSLGDGGFQMVGVDLVPRIGGTTHDLEPSAIREVMVRYFSDGYPSGALTALGYPTAWLGSWPLATFQPFQTLLLAVGGLAGAVLARETGLVGRRGLAVVGLVAGAAPLTAAFALQGSIKEVGGAALFVATAAALAHAWPALAAGRRRAAIPAGVVAGAAIGVVGPGIGPLLLALSGLAAAAMVLRLRRRGGWGAAVVAVLVAAGVTLVANLPAVLAAVRVSDAAASVLTAKEELGNLPRALPWWKAAAGWDSYDYRTIRAYGHAPVSYASGALTLALVAVAALVAVRRRVTVLVAMTLASVVATWCIVRIGSPWAGGKALAIAAMPLWTVAAIAALHLAGAARPLVRWAGRAAAAALVGIVALTAAFAYRGALLSPPDRFDELRELAALVDDRPVLINEFDEFAKVAFVDRRPQTAGENAFDQWPLAQHDGVPVLPGAVPVEDALARETLEPFGWVVARRGPASAWPGPAFVLHRTTRHYWLFRRTTDRRPRIWRPVLPEDRVVEPVACRRIERLGPGGFALVRPTALVEELTRAPSHWVARENHEHVRDTRGTGHVDQPIDVPRSGRYRIWLEGSFNRRTIVALDGRAVGAVPRGATNQIAQVEPVGDERGVHVQAGRRVVRVTRGGGGMGPGTGRNSGSIGRVWLEPLEPPRLVAAEDLPCGLDGRVSVDWYGRW